MIPEASITYWSRGAPWPSRNQVEQDLVLSRLLCEIASRPLLRDELALRGGTCLHKIHLPNALRYSEDLDYVRTTNGPIGPLLDQLREIAEAVGMEAATDVGRFPKFFFRSTFESGAGRLRIKVEIDTHETAPARPHIRLPHRVESPWWSGSAEVLTFEPAELIATKLRALYQRRKGRDLFDLWLALTRMNLDPNEIVACFDPYRPDGYTRAMAVANLEEHVADAGFRTDLLALVGEDIGFDVDEGAARVAEELLQRLP